MSVYCCYSLSLASLFHSLPNDENNFRMGRAGAVAAAAEVSAEKKESDAGD